VALVAVTEAQQAAQIIGAFLAVLVEHPHLSMAVQVVAAEAVSIILLVLVVLVEMAFQAAVVVTLRLLEAEQTLLAKVVQV
jgi:hypothetical protein